MAVPTSNDPAVVVFADDSITEILIVAAAAVVSVTDVPAAEEALAEAKRSVGVAPDEVLHCRTIFSGDARRGTAWETVKPEALESRESKWC